MGHPFQTDRLAIDGMTVEVSYTHDEWADAPWDNSDCNGPVRKTSNPHREGCSDKRPGERPMNSAGRNEYQFYYDWKAAMKIAKKDGWNTQPYDASGKAQRAVEADFKYLQAWVNNDWVYCCVEVKLIDDEGDEIASDSLGCVETWKDYHEECAKEMAEAIVASHKSELAEQALAEHINNRFHDAMSLGV